MPRAMLNCMNAVRRTTTKMSYAEYLAAEEVSEVKHEYLGGEVFAMAGGTIEHGRLAANMIRELGKALEGRPCVVLTSDVRVRIQATDLSTYPDVTVACGKLEKADEDAHAITNPTLIVEVLSDSTEAYDRGEKFASYRTVPTLTDYLLVAQDRPRIEHYTRRDARSWLLDEAGPGERLRVASLDCDIVIDEIYLGAFDA